MKIVSIGGVDGSGKTTLVQQFSNLALPLTTLRCPQYFESGSHRFDALARTFEDWSQYCDREKNTPLKAVVLFLQMSLYGLMEEDQKKAFPDAKLLLRERDPVLDTLVYSPLYVQILGAYAPVFPQEWAQNQSALAHLKYLHGNLNLGFESLEFSNLRDYILRFFSAPSSEMPKNCLTLFRASPANVVLLLKLEPELLQARLKLKHQARPGAQEHHEEQGLLLKLQGGLETLSKQLAGPFGFDLKTIDINESNQNEVFAKVEAIIRSLL